MKQSIPPWLKRLLPQWATVTLSVLLSWIALSAVITPNNDGMLYIEAARLYQEGGFAAASGLFDWNGFARGFVSANIAWTAALTGLELEHAAFLLCLLFIAGTCALIVSCCEELFPGTAWWAVVAVLTIPSLNGYRDYILREFGAWFFVFLALYLLLVWMRKGQRRRILVATVAIVLAAMYRPESSIFLLLLPLAMLLKQPEWLSAFRNPRFTAAVLFVALVGAAVLWGLSHWVEAIGRLTERSNPFRETSALTSSVELMAGILPKWSAGEAGLILVVGLLALIPVKLLGTLGLLVVPVLTALSRRSSIHTSPGLFLFLAAFLLHLVLLVWFVLERQFMTSRYVTLASLLLLPLAAVGLKQLFERGPQWRWSIGVLAVLLMISNVVSTSPPKTRYLDAANWLSTQALEPHRVSLETPDVAHLVGWSFTQAARGMNSRDEALAALRAGQLDLLMLEIRTDDSQIEQALLDEGFELVARFGDDRQRTVLAVRDGPVE